MPQAREDSVLHGTYTNMVPPASGVRRRLCGCPRRPSLLDAALTPGTTVAVQATLALDPAFLVSTLLCLLLRVSLRVHAWRRQLSRCAVLCTSKCTPEFGRGGAEGARCRLGGCTTHSGSLQASLAQIGGASALMSKLLSSSHLLVICHCRISPEHNLKCIRNILTGTRRHQLPQQRPPGRCDGPEQERK